MFHVSFLGERAIRAFVFPQPGLTRLNPMKNERNRGGTVVENVSDTSSDFLILLRRAAMICGFSPSSEGNNYLQRQMFLCFKPCHLVITISRNNLSDYLVEFLYHRCIRITESIYFFKPRNKTDQCGFRRFARGHRFAKWKLIRISG